MEIIILQIYTQLYSHDHLYSDFEYIIRRAETHRVSVSKVNGYCLSLRHNENAEHILFCALTSEESA